MDTRTKIVDRQQVPAEAAWFSGHFDPLLAEHVRMLREAKAPGQLLAVEITNPARPLLAQRARAELVAGLADVDHVVLADGVSGRTSDSGVTGRFIQHVRERLNGAKP
jgi:bifunctional ADP-heptose synthase (sugar kinase/adenylyltransferase)